MEPTREKHASEFVMFKADFSCRNWNEHTESFQSYNVDLNLFHAYLKSISEAFLLSQTMEICI